MHRQRNHDYKNTQTDRSRKYDQFTPRKRYLKQCQNQDVQPVSPNYSPRKYGKYTPKNSIIRKTSPENHQQQYQYPSTQQPLLYKFDEDLIINKPLDYRASLGNRKQKYQEKEIAKKLTFEYDENMDLNNAQTAKFNHIETDRKPLSTIKHEFINKELSIPEKAQILRNKIAKLQRMNPQSSSIVYSRITTTRTMDRSRVNERTYNNEEQPIEYEYTRRSIPDRSREKQNELMSRVSLGRLQQEEQGEMETEVIQDLSYRISNKLQSIIRNYGP